MRDDIECAARRPVGDRRARRRHAAHAVDVVSRHGERRIVVDILLARLQGMQKDIAPIGRAAVDLDLVMGLPTERDPRVDRVERCVCHLVILRREDGRRRVGERLAHRLRLRRCGNRRAVVAERLHRPVEIVLRQKPREGDVYARRIDAAELLLLDHASLSRAHEDAHLIAHRPIVGRPAQEHGGG